MGLDMYLTAKQYASTFNENDKEIREYLDKAPVDKRLGKPDYLVFDVKTWRKANAIHKWFVENVQEGKDDCKEYYLTIEHLKKLLSICQQVIKDPSKASELLPSESGFFFGSTEYDEWYYEDVKDTAEVLEGVVEYCNEGKTYLDFYYQSSW